MKLFPLDRIPKFFKDIPGISRAGMITGKDMRLIEPLCSGRVHLVTWITHGRFYCRSHLHEKQILKVLFSDEEVYKIEIAIRAAKDLSIDRKGLES